MPTKIEKDAVTGTMTTGHEWDGIRELNTPLPKWWLWVFYASIVWSIARTRMFCRIVSVTKPPLRSGGRRVMMTST